MATFKERLIAGLKAKGWVEDPSNRSKYTAFIHPDKVKYPSRTKRFVGESGALRKGECASRSFSIGCPSHPTLVWFDYLKAGDEALKPADEKEFM